MGWALVDAAVVVLALALAAGAGLALWRRLQALGRDLVAASAAASELTQAVEDLSASREPVTAPSSADPLDATSSRHSSQTGAYARPGRRRSAT